MPSIAATCEECVPMTTPSKTLGLLQVLRTTSPIAQ